jgi:hypothetical protein
MTVTMECLYGKAAVYQWHIYNTTDPTNELQLPLYDGNVLNDRILYLPPYMFDYGDYVILLEVKVI